ncbi:MAG TPA: CDC48 family AAA ATPase [Methanospirillum sp.]|uniref:CDC48 family AAA ATPase n=1 Tax=Methanospirillum sp. TaxID=45200 RepID=UPI002BEECA6D|nr:CDC48 family AAA ATPase [Methanospirillum sp.]HOJ96080.1 CDC48 family AAA ATPase [Methanospirillum sp.]
MTSKSGIRLEVRRAAEEDAGKGLARIHPAVMRALGIVNGEFIEILGAKRAVAAAWSSQSTTHGRNDIAIDGEIRSNAGCGIDDRVIVRRVSVHDVRKVILQPVTSISLNNPEVLLAKKLRGRPVIEGQTVRIDLIGNTVTFVVSSLEPRGTGVVTFTTEVILNDIPYQTEEKKSEELSIHYEDIGGLSREISLIREMVEIPLRYPRIFERLGIDSPKGVLLYGPPGTGKTLLGRAVASEVDAHFIPLSGPEVMSRYYGDSEKKIREIFEEARQKAPSIIFIDEIDSIATKRQDTSGEVERRVTAQILTMMDGLASRGQVVVIAATNMPDSIDPALRRGGRFDREIEIGIPDRIGRLEIYHVHTRTMPLADDVDLEYYAETSYGFVGADIALHCKEAAMHALRGIMGRMKEDEEVPAELIDSLMITNHDFQESRKGIEPSAMRELYIEIPEVPWEMVAGLDAEKHEIEKIIEWPVHRREAFEKLKIKPPKGILLFGPPGTGKTLLAKAVAAKSRMNFIAVKGPELLSKWVGESEKQVREAFRKARQSAPSIIFFDEIDALVQKRGQEHGTSRVGESVLSQILTEMDGVEDLSGVIIMAATNRPDLLDPALLRPGRLEKHIYIKPPDKKGRREILELYLKDLGNLLDEHIDYDSLAEEMHYFVGADINAFVREVKMNLLDDVFTKAKKPDEVPRITTEYLKNILSTMQGTLDNKNLEIFESGAWTLLYPRNKQQILHRSAYLLKQVERAGLITELPPDLLLKSTELRDLTFWLEKDFPKIEALTNELEEMLSSCIQKKNSDTTP